MAKTSAELMMGQETRVSFGEVPDNLHGVPLAENSWEITAGEFLLRAGGQHFFFYRRGEGITIHRGADADVSEESLWLNGSVYAAIASMNGLLPIHASAVAVGERVFAFTGLPGAGKSTLVAALGRRGLPMFCDDTLVLDLSDPRLIICLPGHKRLKLTSEAVMLTGVNRGEKVSRSVDKFYCTPPAGEVGVALPLAELIFLEEGSHAAITPISGFERFGRMQDDHYTAHLYAGAQEFDRGAKFEHLASLANRIEMALFTRPLEGARFDDGIQVMADYLSHRGADRPCQP